MLIIGLLKVVTLLLSMSTGSLVLGLDSMSQESSEELKSYSERLAESTSRLGWITRLSQQEMSLFYSELWPHYNLIQTRLEACKTHNDTKGCITQTFNELFDRIMESDSLADKVKILQTMDPFLNNETAKFLVKKRFNSLKNSSSALDLMIIGEIKAIDKNVDNARDLLSKKCNLTDISAIDSSSWFLLNQLALYSLSLLDFNKKGDRIISRISRLQIILRADTNLEFLLKSMDADYDKYNIDVASQWYPYLVDRSPFKDVQLYDTRDGWKFVGKALSLEGPKIIADTLDTTLLLGNEGSRNYLLLLQEDAAERLIKLDPTNLDELYSCFTLGVKIKSFDYFRGTFPKIPRERHAELSSHVAKLESNLPDDFIVLQQKLPYLKIASLLKENGTDLCADRTREFTNSSKTLELLDIIGRASIRAIIQSHWMKSFSRYLLERLDCEEAVEEHFHYYISAIMSINCQVLADELAEYFGIKIGINEQQTISAIEMCISDHVDCTMEKIPRHQMGYLEITEKSTQQDFGTAKRLEIAFWGSLFNDETVDFVHKEDFVHYILKGVYKHLTKRPAFVDLARIYYKDTNRNINDIMSFLYFERLVHNQFPNLKQMDLEKGFQRILAKDSFSTALRHLIARNFYFYRFPFALGNLQILEKEMLKSNVEMAIRLQLKRIPTKTLLKAIRQALCDDCTDLKLSITKYLLNYQFLSVGSV